MSFFKKLFGESESESETPEASSIPNSSVDETEFEPLVKSNWASLDELFEQYGALSFEKQLLLGNVIGGNSWQFDMGSGTISFGSELSFQVQVIGSLSFGNSSWMWGWANSKSGIPESLLGQSLQMKKWGEERGITELSEGHFEVEEGFEHKIGMIACGLYDSNAYYCANYGQGTLVVTIDNPDIPEIDYDQVDKVLLTFPQFISGMDVHHKNAFVNYLIDRDFQIKATDTQVEGLRNGNTVVGEFDSLGRLVKLNGNFS